jgi:hypothetical protein
MLNLFPEAACPRKRWPVSRKDWVAKLIPSETGHRMYHTTGFTRDELVDLCILINSVKRDPGSPAWLPRLGLFKSVVATLTYMRHNRIQAEIGE